MATPGPSVGAEPLTAAASTGTATRASAEATARQPRISAATLAAVEGAAGVLSSAATHRMELAHDWYRELSADDRSWVGLVAQAGIASFLGWLRSGEHEQLVTADVFGTAPRELTRSVTLRQTLDLIRSVVDVVEVEATGLAAPGDEVALRESVLRYSREVAFSAAQVYAGAAEARGAWDARLESLVVDAVLRGEADTAVQSRAAALGWASVHDVTVVAGSAPLPRHPMMSTGQPTAETRAETSVETTIEALRRTVARARLAPRRQAPGSVTARPSALAGVHGSQLVVILGGTREVLALTTAMAHHFADGPIVIGPTVPHLLAAGRSARAALSGLGAAPGWPQAPRVVAADDLLPERALAGDAPARSALVERVHDALLTHPSLLETASAYLEGGSGLEAAARVLFVHPNTVRYRLGRIAELTGYDLTEPRDAYAARLALTFGRLAHRPSRSWRPTPAR